MLCALARVMLKNITVAAAMCLSVLLLGPSSANAEVVAEYTLSEGWATFGLAVPQGLARATFQVGALATQTDIKTTWPDGSIRFAVLTAKIPAAGVYAITSGPGAVGS